MKTKYSKPRKILSWLLLCFPIWFLILLKLDLLEHLPWAIFYLITFGFLS